MPKLRIGINGFGRIGRLACRACAGREDVVVAAINDPHKDPNMMQYLLTYDSVHGHFQGQLSHTETQLCINGDAAVCFTGEDPAKIPWHEAGVDYVLECSGRFTTVESVMPHITVGGAKKVLISAPSKDAPTFVMGVNEKTYTPDMDVVCNASCTTNCLAPLAKIIDEHFGIESALMSTIHAVTASQRTADTDSHKNWRLGRSAVNNIIPTSTGAAKAVGKVLPNLKGKLTGMAFRVPTTDVSVVDLTVCLKTPATLEQVFEAVKNASEGELKGIVRFCDEELVSTDFTGCTETCCFDSKACIGLTPTFMKLVAWYDNEAGYSAKLVDLAQYIYSCS